MQRCVLYLYPRTVLYSSDLDLTFLLSSVRCNAGEIGVLLALFIFLTFLDSHKTKKNSNLVIMLCNLKRFQNYVNHLFNISYYGTTLKKYKQLT